MEAYFLTSPSQDGCLSLSTNYKHQLKKNPMTTFNHPLISHPSETFNSRGGFLHAPPPPFLSHSFPPPVITSQYFKHHHRLRQQQQQPPLLPLPIPVQQNYVNPSPSSSRTRGSSFPPVSRKMKNKNPTRNLHQTYLAPPRKSSKPSKRSTSNTVVPPKKPVEMVKENIVETAAINVLGPDPKDLLPKVLMSNINDEVIVVNHQAADHKFSGSVVLALISPPPSSLPLPTFSLRPKLSRCNVQAAAGVDTGATDTLRRLLRLL